MKYASGEEPMVGDVVECVNEKFTDTSEWIIRFGDVNTIVSLDGYWLGLDRMIGDLPAKVLPSWMKLVRRALPFLDGSGVFHTEKPKHRYPRRWKSCNRAGEFFEQLHEGGDVLYHFRNMVSGTGWTVGELEREREETFDHHDAKPASRFDEGGMYRSERTACDSELDTLREKLRAVEANLQLCIDELTMADAILFDIYSNSQKLNWSDVEAMANVACKRTRMTLNAVREAVR